MLQLQEQYITNAQGDRIAVILNIEAYQKLLDEMDEFLCWKGYQQAVEETDSELTNGDFVTLDSYIDRLGELFYTLCTAKNFSNTLLAIGKMHLC